MGYVDSAPYFCCTSDMVEDFANLRWFAISNTTPHPLMTLIYTPLDTKYYVQAGIISSGLDASITVCLPTSSPFALLHYIDVYIKNFIALAQLGPEDRRRACDHVFHLIDRVF